MLIMNELECVHLPIHTHVPNGQIQEIYCIDGTAKVLFNVTLIMSHINVHIHFTMTLLYAQNLYSTNNCLYTHS